MRALHRVTYNLLWLHLSRARKTQSAHDCCPFKGLALPWPVAVARCRGPLPWLVAVARCRGPLPWPVAVARCRGSLPWLVAVARCRGSLPWLVAVARCRGSLPWLVAVARCRGPLPWPVARDRRIVSLGNQSRLPHRITLLRVIPFGAEGLLDSTSKGAFRAVLLPSLLTKLPCFV